MPKLLESLDVLERRFLQARSRKKRVLEQLAGVSGLGFKAWGLGLGFLGLWA